MNLYEPAAHQSHRDPLPHNFTWEDLSPQGWQRALQSGAASMFLSALYTASQWALGPFSPIGRGRVLPMECPLQLRRQPDLEAMEQKL